MSKLEQLLLLAMSLILGVGLTWVSINMWRAPRSVSPATIPAAPSAAGYRAAKAAEDPANPCATPPGYTDEEWREHMSHHPDQYAACLASP